MSCLKPSPITRRDALRKIGGGFAMMSFAGMVNKSIAEADATPAWKIKDPHFKPKAKHVIFLFMNGGLSQVDSFDPKPMLAKYNGQPMPGGDLGHERKTGSLMPPAHIRNAPTKLMKDLGYGKGYQYDPDAEDGFSGTDFFPEGMERRTFYKPKGEGHEAKVKERLERWAELRARKQRG